MPADSREGRLPLACVLFDLDGTLIDTTTLIFESYRYTLDKMLGYIPTDEELLSQYGRPLADAMRELVVALGQSGGLKIEEATETDQPAATVSAQTPGQVPSEEALVDRLVKAYRRYNARQHDALIRPFPRVNETLAELQRRGYVLGIVTSKGRAIAERSIAHYGLDAFMETVITADDTPVHKPHPRPIFMALANVGRQPRETLFVGDSPLDVQAGRAAGTLTAAAFWGPFAHEELLAEHPDYTPLSLPDLLAICPPHGS
ncbi:MAG: HAD-IA family hydrolase [Chloroflexota bacterium]